MIELKNLTLQRGSKLLLDKANLTVSPQRRVGLVGRNGTGKSSLFALIKGEIAQDGGDVLLPTHWKLASVAQETPALVFPKKNTAGRSNPFPAAGGCASIWRRH